MGINKHQHKPNILLKHEREKRGWSQNRLGELIGADPTMISRWEHGSRNPERIYQEKLCEVFNKNAIELGFISNTSTSAATVSEAPTTLNQTRQDEQGQTESIINLTQETWRAQHGQILAHYLQQKRTHMLNALIPGSTNLCVGDIVDNSNLFIPPPWEMVQGPGTSPDLVTYLIDTLIAGQRILLLGDAGQGKTTILKQVFNLLVNRFLNEPESSYPIPFYIPLREFSYLTGNAIEVFWTHVHDELSLPFEDFASLVRNQHIVFLFDGFDEIKGELTQQALNERTASKIFAQPSILTCRKSFFEFHLSMSPLQEHYPQWIELQPLALTQSVSRYIAAFYQRKQHITAQKSITTPESIMKIIQNSQELQDLARRPLLLVMMLDIFTDPREIREEEWNVTKLYGKYTEKWLKNEAAKPGSLLKWNEKALLLQETAWLTYAAKVSTSSPYRLNQSETFTQNELESVLKNIAGRYQTVTEAQLLDELCFRTLLAVSEADNYYFLHKTFHEYYVARYIFEHMRTRGHNTDTDTIISEILQEVLPFEVVTFLKEMLNSKEIVQNEKDLIVHNLIMVYQMHQGDDFRLVTIRQHASHYLTSLGTPKAIQFLEQTYNQEPNKWVQRGIMVGLALYCNKTNILEQYITMIRNDPEVASINLGYHLVYYGDQAQEYGYYDQRGERCDGTLRSLFRHLNNERHKNSWPLDLLTLSALLETRGIAILASHKQELPFLKEFLKQEHREQNSTFQQEKEHLEKIIQGADLWR
jgi:transcriptional regulator with XRE-family HTH domain